MNHRTTAKTVRADVHRKAEGEARPLTRMQLRLWMGRQFDTSGAGYHMAFAFTVDGVLDRARFDAAFQAVLDRTDALRTIIEETAEGPRRRVLPPFRFAVAEVDLSEAPDPKGALEEWLGERIARALRLDERLFDTALVRTGRRHVWYLNLHHIIADGWTYELVFRRVSEAYARGATVACDALPAWPSYHDFLAERPPVRRVAAAESGAPLSLFDGTAVIRSARERRIRRTFSEERMARLDALAATEGARSLNLPLARTNILAAILFVYLHQLTGRRRLVLGMPFHNRLDEASREVAGLFQETLPVGVEIGEDETFASLLDKTARATWTAMRKVRSGVVEEDPRAFEVMLNYPNVMFATFAGMPVAPRWLHPGFGDGRRLLFVQAHDFGATGRLTLDVDANAGVFDEDRHRTTVDHLVHLLDQCLAEPGRRLDTLDLVPPAEHARVVTGFNRTAAEWPEDLTLADLFERQAVRTPEATALVFGETTLTYAALDARANRWAHELRRWGVGPGVPVAVFAERSPELMAALLALFKAGGAFLPLDAAYPRERLAFMLADAGAPLVLTTSDLREKLPPGAFDVLLLDAPAPVAPAAPPPPRPDTTPADLAYVIYTSGSTGRPKGVAMPMRAIVNLVWWQMRTATRLTRPRTLQFTPLNFDVALQEIFACWCAGGTLVVPTDAVRRDPEAALRMLIDARVEQLYAIFSPLRRLAETAVRLGLYPTSLREVITAGEQVQVTPALVRFFETLPDCTFENQYGPSETHIVTRHLLAGKPRDWPALPPIDRPIANTEIYLLDAHLRPVPVGVPGELFIGGVQVADGYLNRPELTAERFVPDPFSGRAGARLYRTGDLGRFLPSGDIVFLGRKDFQVKVRGYRIELGEIEAALGRHPAVREAAVTVHDAGAGDRRLAAYVVPRAEPPTTEEMRRFLGETLPEYMIPSHFVTLDAMPHTANGKVDRRALPAPEGRPALETAYVPPRTEVEETVAAVWRDVLGLERVGREDNFFTLGGDSLLLVEVHARLRERFEALSIVTLFEYPTIRALAGFLREEETPGAGTERARARARRQKEALRRQMGPRRGGGNDGTNGTPNEGEDR